MTDFEKTVLVKITPLLETGSSASDRVVAWLGPHPKARVVCIQPGAATETHRNPQFRKLLRKFGHGCVRKDEASIHDAGEAFASIRDVKLVALVGR